MEMNPCPRLAPLVLSLWLFLVGLAFGQTQAVASQEPPVSDEYALRVWDLEDGLPNNHVSSLAQTPDGYLWVAMGAGGLARFDGVRFVPFPKDTHPGLVSDNVNELFVARDGALWMGLERGGVARYQEGRFEAIVPVGPLKGPRYIPTGFAEDGEGGIWFSNSQVGTCFRWQKGKLTSFSAGRGDRGQVYADSVGKIWYQISSVYKLFEGGKFKTVDPINRAASHITPAKEGGMWVFCERMPEKSQLLFRCQADGTKEFVADLDALGGLHQSQVNTMFADKFGGLWIGTRNSGLLKYENGRLVRVPTSHSCILNLMEDREGNLWVGTEGGLNRLCRTAFTLHQTRDGLSHDSVISLTQDIQGRIWLVCRDGKTYRGTDLSNRFFAAPPDCGAGVMTLSTDPSGRVWFGTAVGVGFWKEDAVIRLPWRDEYTALLPDSGESLWAASIRGGLILFKNGKAENIPTDNGLVFPRALAQDSTGSIWVGTEQGRVFQQPPAGQAPSSEKPFIEVPLPGAKHQAQIRFIVPDKKDGSVWIGAFGDGLFRWKAGRVTHLSPESGLPPSDLRSLLISGDFWIGTGRGLFRVERQALEAAMEGKPGPIEFISYGRNDGLPSMEYSYGFRNVSAQTPDGHLWLATYSGALEIKPQLLTQPSPPGRVLIESLEVGGTSTATSNSLSHLVLPPHSGPIQIRFTLPEMRAPEQLHFRYRLQGSSDSWISVEGQRVALFEYLPPGNYRFEISAENTGGPWREPSLLEFSVEAAWWETLWFKICLEVLAAVGVAISVRFIVKRRMRARMRRLEQEHALDQERARIARDMHDEFGASLTQISLSTQLAEIESPESAARHIQDIAQITRRTVASLDEIVWAVNPRNDNLAALLDHLSQYTYDYLRSAGIACEVEVPQVAPDIALNAHVRHHLLLAVKEALNNVVKHAQATSVSLKIQFEQNLLQIMVADNGCGFDAKPAALGADGLRNFHDRMRELKGSCRIESSPGKGTRIIFELPLACPGA